MSTSPLWLNRGNVDHHPLNIGFRGGLWIILNYFIETQQSLNSFRDNRMDKGGEWWQNIIIGVRVIICGLLARAFIMVEALVSIRELPVGAYKTPTWTLF